MKCYEVTREGKINAHEHLKQIQAISHIWLIMTPTELAEMKQIFSFRSKTIEECKSSLDIPKIEVYENYDFGLLNVITRDEHIFKLLPFHFYLSKTCLIFVSKSPMQWLEIFEKEVLEEDEELYTLSKILYLLLDKLIDQDAIILDHLETEIEKLEERIIKNEPGDYIKTLIILRKQLGFLKRHYEPLIDIVTELKENDNHISIKKDTRYFKMLQNRVARLSSHILHLEDYVSQIREAYDAQVDIKLNKIMKFFTLVTSIFLPLTLIVGWYGMNFTNMPELSWRYGYIYVITLSILSIISCIYYFKKKRWF